MAKVTIHPIHSDWDLSDEEQFIVAEVCSAKENYQKLRYNPSHRYGAWDGVVQLFNASAKRLPAGLAPDVTEALEAAGFPVTVEWAPHRDFSPRPDAQINFDITEDHQLRALEAMCSYKRGILHAATNSGKTKIAEAWCAMNDFKILYLVPTRELLHQTVKSFKRDTNLEVGHISAEDGWEIGRDVTVALVTSVSKKKSKRTGLISNQKAVDKFKEVAKQFEALIVDECHHVAAEGWRWVVKCCVNAHYRYGLSGTPWNPGDDVAALRVKAFLGPIIATVTNAELIEKGWSATPIIHMIPVHSPEVFVEERNETDEIIFSDIYDPGIVYNDLRNNMIVKLCEKFHEESRTCLVIAQRLAQCEIISQSLKMKRIPHRVITGETPKDERKSDLEAFRDAEFPILISTVLGEGVDIPSLNGLIFAAGGKSSKQMLQRVGRGIRKKTQGENVVEIYDFIDKAHGVLANHTRARRKLYKDEGFEVVETPIRF